MNGWTVACLVTAVMNIGIGALVFLRNPRRLANRTLAIFSANLAVWALVVGFIMMTKTFFQAEMWVRMAFAVGSFLPAHFTLLVFGLGRARLERRQRQIALLLYGLGAATALLTFHPAFIASLSLPSFPAALPGPEVTYDRLLFGLYVCAVALPMAFGIAVLRRRYRRETGMLKAEVFYVFLGVLAGSLWTMATSLIPPFFGTTVPSRFAPFSSVVMSGVIAYGIAKYHILEIPVVVRATTAYTLASVFVFVVFAMLVAGTTQVLSAFHVPGVGTIATAGSAFIVALIFMPVANALQQVLRRKIVSDRYDPDEVSRQVAAVFSMRLPVGELLERSMTSVVAALGIPHRMMLLVPRVWISHPGVFARLPIWCEVRTGEGSHLLRSIIKQGRPLVREEMERTARIGLENRPYLEMMRLGGEVAAGIPTSAGTFGALLVGRDVYAGGPADPGRTGTPSWRRCGTGPP